MARHHLLALAIAAAFVYVKTQTQKPIFPVSCYLNVLIILDRSDSVKGGFNRSRDFVANISDELNVGPNAHRVAMIVYSGLNYRREVYKWNFAKNNAEFQRTVLGLRAIGGTTNTKKALEIGLELMQTRNKSIPTLIMVVTDGRSADDPKEPALALQAIPNTWMFAAATGDPLLADRSSLL
uniref:VWFA domain-containing protein n=1 Tax=Ascaris lumbricoides TaxID=6252 RepID=A0A0M3HUV3_ASCLU